MRRRYVVEGDVQGVGFRFFTSRQAQRLGITGWVRNLPDGRVEADAEGTDAQLASFEEALRRGPGSATVTSVLVEELPDRGDGPAFFSIR